MKSASHVSRAWRNARARPKRLLALACVMGACAAPHVAVKTGPSDPKQLSETQALLAVQEALVQGGALAERGFPLTLDGQQFIADIRFGTPPFAIEWLTVEQRARFGDRLPKGSPKSPLQIAWCKQLADAVQMLVLDATVYEYEGNPLLVQRGARGIDDAERRVRHDVAEFVEYVRNQGVRF